MLVVLIGVAAALGLWLGLAAGDGPEHPDRWDPRVEDLASFVEDQRERSFEHPVAVRFLDEDAYRKRINDAEAPTAAERRQAADDVASQRAIGILDGKLDPFEAGQDLAADGSAAFYDDVTETIYVQGRELTPATRVTVVHELTHALQDQVVGLSELGADDTLDRSGALGALVEGDATDVENAWVSELGQDELDQVFAEEDRQAEESSDQLDAEQVPDAWQAAFGLPYTYGPALVATVLDDGGPDALWKLYGRRGITSTQAFLDLRSDPRREVVEVEDPDVPTASRRLSEETWGVFSWMVPLAEYTDWRTMGTALERWQGDTVVVSRAKGGPVCVDARVAFAGKAGSRAFADATGKWLAALPAESQATSQIDGDEVTIHTCDPGAEVRVPVTGRAERELQGPAIRNQIATEVASGPDVELSDGFCTADGIIEHYGMDALIDTDVTAEADYRQVAEKAAGSCGLTFDN